MTITTRIPDGFAPHTRSSPLTEPWEPIYAKHTGSAVILALRLPSQKAFMVGTITMADEDGKTRYTATVRHWSAEDRDTHEKMGFHEGWGKATEQLEELAKTL